MDERPPFHLAFPVGDLEHARAFYGRLLGCREGRSAERWVDFDFFGHQISAHLAAPEDIPTSEVDGDRVPVRHFGVVLTPERWEGLAERLRKAGVPFLIEPRVRFAGQAGEQSTFFVRDPSGNVLEFKAFAERERLFRREP
jgi:extradiol dioxygenase family protein